MTGMGMHLLKRLEPPIRPTWAGDAAPHGRAPIEGQTFDELLTLVADGSIRSDRPVALAFSPREDLTADQLARLGAAADDAEAHGARRALLLIDGRGLVLDVAARQLETELTGHQSEAVIPLDAAIFVTDDDADETRGRIAWPGYGHVPRAVAVQIARAYETGHGRAGDDPASSQLNDRRQAG